MHIRCPHCCSPVEVIDQDLTLELTCPSCGSSFSLVDRESTTKHHEARIRLIGRFELLDQLGIGAFGTVWKARDRELDRIVAVKIPRKAQLGPKEVEQFLREARAAAQLRHPNIVSVHEVGRADDTVYIVSDLVHGFTLSEWLSGQHPTPDEAASICVEMAQALHHAHEQQVVHRDLKPGNVMLDSDRKPHLMDFGLAKREAGEITMTADGHVLGTPAYMSPEQARGEGHTVDRRADIYSLGVILFQMLTGELPFRGTPRMLLHQVLNDEPRSPRSLNDRIPRDLETITLKAMAKEPARRYQAAQELADDLKRFLAGQPIVARPVGPAERAWRWAKRNPVVAALAAGLLVSLTVGLASVTWQWRRAETALAAEQRQRDAAQREHQRAETHLQRSRRAVDQYFTLISEGRLLDEPGLQPLRQELLEHALRYYEEFSQENAYEPRPRAELAAAQLRLGQIRLVMGQTDEALACMQRAVTVVKQLLDEGVAPEQFPRWFTDWFHVPRYNRRDSAVPSDPSQALALLKDACSVWERLAASVPESTGFRRDLAGCYYYYGDALFIGGQHNAAEYFQKACRLLKSCAIEQPDDLSYREDYALAASDAGVVLSMNGQPTEAAALYEDALRFYPTSPALQNGLARLLVSSAGVTKEDASRAVGLAHAATSGSHREAEYWNTYGIALYRNGDAEGAIDKLKKSMELRDGGDGWDWFNLAMAEHRRKNNAAAQDWFDKAVEWYGQQNPRTMIRIQPVYKEAAKTLGLSGPTKP